MLSGRSLYVDELERLGLGTERVVNQVRRLVRDYNFKRSEMRDRGIGNLDWSTVRGGTDPWGFLRDESGREDLGDPGERD